MKVKSIKKNLTNNDIGANGSHQAGLHFPKGNEFYSFFPKLDEKTSNPRVKLTFLDEVGVEWHFVFLHYNNKRVISKTMSILGTRDEFRLTHMTKYFREKALSAGDSIIFSKDKIGNYLINFEKFNNLENEKIWEVEFL